MKRNKPDFEGGRKLIETFLTDEAAKKKVFTVIENCKKKITFGKNGCDNAFAYVDHKSI